MSLTTDPTHSDSDSVIRTLQSELSAFLLSGFVLLLAVAGGLASITGFAPALLWLLAAGLCFAFVCHQTGKRLHLNRFDKTSALYPDLGWANRMTMMRGWLIAATGGFLLIPSVMQQFGWLVWIAAAAYSVAAVFDRLDGFIARKTRRSSLLGAELDTVFDALGLLVAPLLALQLGKIHMSYLLVSVAYYLFVLGIKFRQHHQKPVYPLAPSKLRRTLAGFQMGYVAVVLWPPFQADVTVAAGFGFMLPLLAGFLVDWCVVSGRLDPLQPRTAKVLQSTHTLTNDVLLPLIRVTTLAAIIYLSSDAWLSWTYVAAAGISLMLITTGLAGRVGAMCMLMLLAWTAPAAAFDPVMLLALYSTIAIVLLGCGRFSLWQADDDWVNRQDGA